MDPEQAKATKDGMESYFNNLEKYFSNKEKWFLQATPKAPSKEANCNQA
jgi:hypothetical protein